MDDTILFNVKTPLGFSVHVTREYWDFITTIKHPVMKGGEERVIKVLSDPDEIRQSKSDKNVYLFYRKEQEKRWQCAVAKDETDSGFLITAYPTDKIKEGEMIWKK
ncbi:MAG TPA: DUF4258 domain-containing protein [Spirochaetota bacterium]|nr:DUF4258 domain-containing protein [Spirochaetota bacterium]